MMYRLKKDLGSLKKGAEMNFVNGVFMAGEAAFDPMDVVTDTEHFEEVSVDNYEAVDTLSFQTL